MPETDDRESKSQATLAALTMWVELDTCQQSPAFIVKTLGASNNRGFAS